MLTQPVDNRVHKQCQDYCNDILRDVLACFRHTSAVDAKVAALQESLTANVEDVGEMIMASSSGFYRSVQDTLASVRQSVKRTIGNVSDRSSTVAFWGKIGCYAATIESSRVELGFW